MRNTRAIEPGGTSARRVTFGTFVPPLLALAVALLLLIFVTFAAFVAFAVLVILTGFLYDWSKKWTRGQKVGVAVVVTAFWFAGLVFIATQIGIRVNAAG